MTQAPSRKDVIEQDVADLHKLGYAQELFRSMGGFSNFAISFSIISILTGAVILYDYGLAWAGTAAVLIGWPFITLFVLCIAAAMGEIASAYPTAGGLYYWASRMKSKNWGWWTAWLNLIGQFAIVAGINFAAALFINATIVTPLLSSVGIDYSNTTVLIGTADQPILVGSLLTMGILMLLQLVINIAGINVVALLNQVSVWWHIGIVAAVVVLVFLAGKPDESGLTLFAIQPQDARRQLEQQPRVRQPPVWPRHHLPADPRLLLLPAPGELDVYRVRRIRPRRRGDGRRADGQCVGDLPVGRSQRGRRIHLPVHALDPPAEPVDALPESVA